MTHMSEQTVKSIAAEYKISNADFHFRQDATIDELIDVIEGNRIYVPCIYVLNKIDQISIEELDIIDKCPHYVQISAKHERNLDELLEKVCRPEKVRLGQGDAQFHGGILDGRSVNPLSTACFFVGSRHGTDHIVIALGEGPQTRGCKVWGAKEHNT